MAYEIKGDLTVKRTIVADRRADQGLNAATITGAETLVRHSAAWQALSAAAGQDVNLPVALNVTPAGWRVVVQATGAADLTVKDSTGSTIEVVEAGRAYKFILTDDSDAAGTWYVNFLENADVLPASRYTITHNNTTDWTADGSDWKIETTAATHGRGTRPTFQFFETSTGNEIQVTPNEAFFATATGNHTFKVPGSPECRYEGKVIFV